MCPEGASLPVSHLEHAVQQPSRLKGEALSIDYRVEPDPRTAFNSKSDEQRLAAYVVVDDVMVAKHPHRVGTNFTSEFNPED